MHKDLIQQFQLLLNNLIEEIKAYPDEESLWAVKGDIKNAAGTLCYHLCGNLNHYIGKGMGKTGYVRNRPLEFSIRNVPKADLIKWINETADMIEKVVPDVDLAAPTPKELWNRDMSNGHALLRTLWHLGWHLGQVNYHRRIIFPDHLS
ncbi:MAG: DinB superfamily protein [Bacteroidota bacterium]